MFLQYLPLLVALAALAVVVVLLIFSRREDARLRGENAQLREENAVAKTRLDAMENQLQDSQRRAQNAEQSDQQVRQSLSESREESAAAKTRARELETQLQQEKQRANTAEQRRDAVQNAEAEARREASRLQAELQAERDSAAEKIKLLRQARDELSNHFEALAQQVLERKTDAFDKSAREKLDGVVKPLADDLEKFRARAEEIHTARSKESAALRENITALQRDAGQLAEDANNLTRALKGDKKALGDWGETTLERILEESGLRRGSEYQAQPATLGADGKPQRPDFKILLPEGRHLIVDSKASLVAYHAYVSAKTDAERERALSEHVIAVRNHARALSEKHYQRGRGTNSPDFVFMFMPIEAAWMAALLTAERLFDDSYNRKVILVARTTLLPALKTVAQLWKFERQNENAREIADLAGRMHDKFADLLGELGKIDRHLESARTAHREAVRKLEGRDNLMRQAERLTDMGANAKKKLPRRDADGE